MRRYWKCMLPLLLLRDLAVCWNRPIFQHRRTQRSAIEETTSTVTTASTSASESPQDRISAAPSAHSIARSFVTSSFDPLLTGGHLQSILGFFLRESCAYVPRGNFAALVRQALPALVVPPHESSDEEWFWDARERVETPDGDWFHADTKYGRTVDDADIGRPTTTRPTVLLLHGLCSSSNSTLARDLGRAFTQRGMDCVCLNFRGCSGTMNSKLGGYHLGFTDDLRHFLSLQRYSGPVFLVGYSLGANVVLKCLGELGDTASQRYNVAGAVALCAPLDQTRNAAVLAQPGIRRVYTSNLLSSLKPMVERQLNAFCNGDPQTPRFDYPGVAQATTITDFDQAFIAPVYGFSNATDYYQKTSSIHQLDKIAVPTMILNAEDDPFLDPAVWPMERCCTAKKDSPVRLVRTQHGGHLGFCFHQVDDASRISPLQPSWASSEAASFVCHVLSQQSVSGSD